MLRPTGLVDMNFFISVFLWLVPVIYPEHPVCHDFHVSKLDVRYNPVSKNYELTLHLFLDDLEAAMVASGYRVNRIEADEEDEKTIRLVHSYLTTKIRLKADGKLLKLSYIGLEEAERVDAVFIYLEVADAGKPGQLSVDNQLFHEIFTDQKNIVSVMDDKKLKAFEILDKSQTIVNVTF